MESKHGGMRQGQGRKPLEEERMINFSIRMTRRQKRIMESMGGPEWIRKIINEQGDIQQL